jgi:hypothetical protein
MTASRQIQPSCAVLSGGSFSPVSGPQGYAAGAAALGQERTHALQRNDPARVCLLLRACRYLRAHIERPPPANTKPGSPAPAMGAFLCNSSIVAAVQDPCADAKEIARQTAVNYG